MTKEQDLQDKYNEDYYLRGITLRISNYEDYRWLEERTMEMAKRIIEVLGIKEGDTLLDYGAARGFTVKALHRLGVDAWGYDVSEWAVANCDPEVKHRVHTTIKHQAYDFIWMKDLAEHLTIKELEVMFMEMFPRFRKKMIVIVPLAKTYEGDYVRQEDNADITHVIRWTLKEWMKFIADFAKDDSITVSGSWHIPGLKPTSFSHPKSCGFITIEKLQ